MSAGWWFIVIGLTSMLATWVLTWVAGREDSGYE